ncbi:hypothetical protein LINGRAHAP2_LOCUS19801 [Linum grandiflorum]
MGLPLEYYNDDELFAITKCLGSPIRFDRKPSLVTCGKFACVCMEIDLSHPLPPEIGVDDEWFGIEYEGLKSICSHCRFAGHLVDNYVLLPTQEDQMDIYRDGQQVKDTQTFVDRLHIIENGAKPNQAVRKHGPRKTGNQRKEVRQNRGASQTGKEDGSGSGDNSRPFITEIDSSEEVLETPNIKQSIPCNSGEKFASGGTITGLEVEAYSGNLMVRKKAKQVVPQVVQDHVWMRWTWRVELLWKVLSSW